MRDPIRYTGLGAVIAALAVLLQPTPPAWGQQTSECLRPADSGPVLLVSAAELGEGWCLEDRRAGAESRARYRNAADDAAPRRATFWAYLAPSRDEVLEPFITLVDLTVDEGRGRSWFFVAPELGDGGHAVGLGHVAEDGRSASVSYAFAVDRVNAFVSVRGVPDELDALQAQGLRFARLQELHLRDLVPALRVRRPAAEAAGDCMQFVADVTIPDGTEVAPGQELKKVWRLANCGRTTWDGYRAVHIAGEDGPPAIDLPRTVPGATADLTAVLQAPASAGRKRVYYEIEGPNGGFGDTFFIEIVVVDRNPPAAPSVRPAPVQLPR